MKTPREEKRERLLELEMLAHDHIKYFAKGYCHLTEETDDIVHYFEALEKEIHDKLVDWNFRSEEPEEAER